MEEKRNVRPIPKTLRSYGRSLAGALIFAIPAIFTMEIWWRGLTPHPARLAFFLASGFGLLCMYEYYTGLHGQGRRGLPEAIGEACEGLLIGLLFSWLILSLLGVLPEITSFREWLGKVISVGIPVSVGVAIGDSQLGKNESSGSVEQTLRKSHHTTLHQFAFSIMGAVVIAAGIAPTEEIVLLAYGLEPLALTSVLLLSVGVSIAVTSIVEFRGTSGRNYAGGALGAASVTYLGAFLTTIILLVSNESFGGNALPANIAAIVVVGLPASVGAAAAKALIV